MNRICHIEIDEKGLARPRPRSNRNAAWRSLICWRTTPLPCRKREGRAVPPGPYRLGLAIREGRLVFDVATEAAGRRASFTFAGPFRQVVKDYFQICESYFDAVKRLPPSQIEAIDMARRGIHNEGARVLQERLEGQGRGRYRYRAASVHPDLRLHWG
jgi:uncharacterized protein (UPF0262 family)